LDDELFGDVLLLVPEVPLVPCVLRSWAPLVPCPLMLEP